MKSLLNFILESDQSGLIRKFKQKYNSLYPNIKHTFEKKHDILIVSTCGASKNHERDIKARDLYKGTSNRLLNINIDKLNNCDWMIFSGGWGAMGCNTVIHDYTDVIMELSKESLRSLADFCKYQSDLCKQLDKGTYKICILNIGMVWWTMLNIEELSEKYSDTKFMCFNHNEDLPDNFYNVHDSHQLFKKLGTARTNFGSTASCYYLTYLKDHEYITVDKFFSGVNNGSIKLPEILRVTDKDENNE